MGALIAIPGAATPIERILGRFDRAQLEGFIAIAIDLLDLADGDPDVERNGDELDGSMGEDDFHDQSADWLGHAGCPIADPGGCEHDGREPDTDSEREQLPHDVPCLRVYSNEREDEGHRTELGLSGNGELPPGWKRA
jgi:hypothetical protein